MIFHRYYTDIPAAEIDRFVQAQELGRLITVGPHGIPHVGLYPFVYDGRTVDLHLVAEDEQTRDLLTHEEHQPGGSELLLTMPPFAYRWFTEVRA